MGFLPEAHHAMSGTLRHEYSQQCRAKNFPPNRAKDSHNSTTYYIHSYNKYTVLLIMTLNVKNVCFYGCSLLQKYCYTPAPAAPLSLTFIRYRSFYVLIRENGWQGFDRNPMEVTTYGAFYYILVHPLSLTLSQEIQ
jgi:hypothetical protein